MAKDAEVREVGSWRRQGIDRREENRRGKEHQELGKLGSGSLTWSLRAHTYSIETAFTRERVRADIRGHRGWTPADAGKGAVNCGLLPAQVSRGTKIIAPDDDVMRSQ
jgi:hypothetical protein